MLIVISEVPIFTYLIFYSVPFPPINFNVTDELHRVSNITVTFEWDPPQESGPAVIVDTYEVSIIPRPLSHPISNEIDGLSWNVTLEYNVEYTATITAENCAGVSLPFTLHAIEFCEHIIIVLVYKNFNLE